MFQQIRPGLPTVYQAIASPECDPSPRPFVGDPYAAAQPLLDRLEEILGTFTANDFSGKNSEMRERILGLAWRVPEWHHHVFQRIIGIAKEIFDGMAPPVVRVEQYREYPQSGFWVAGIGIHNWERTDLEESALALIAPIVAMVKENDESEIIARKAPKYFPPLLNYPHETVKFGDLEIMFRATEEMGFMRNEFRIGVMVSTDSLPNNGFSEIQWKRMREHWNRT